MSKSKAIQVATRAFYDVHLNEEKVGAVIFINHTGQRIWLIDKVSDGLPVNKSDYSSDIAKNLLEERGYTLKHTHSKPQFIYR